ncbi:hypothetical protein EON66_01125 [archaeon]|nr:MAG: hypothetical protein EON66_01125 [archaeon]
MCVYAAVPTIHEFEEVATCKYRFMVCVPTLCMSSGEHIVSSTTDNESKQVHEHASSADAAPAPVPAPSTSASRVGTVATADESDVPERFFVIMMQSVLSLTSDLYAKVASVDYMTAFSLPV